MLVQTEVVNRRKGEIRVRPFVEGRQLIGVWLEWNITDVQLPEIGDHVAVEITWENGNSGVPTVKLA